MSSNLNSQQFKAEETHNIFKENTSKKHYQYRRRNRRRDWEFNYSGNLLWNYDRKNIKQRKNNNGNVTNMIDKTPDGHWFLKIYTKILYLVYH